MAKARHDEGGTVEQASMDLAAMVRPASGKPAPPKLIWDKVVQDDARLPGNWNTTASGAHDAADSCDWALCTYIAARCYADGAGSMGVDAGELAACDTRCHDVIWMETVAPIVLDIPRGREKLCIKFQGKSEPEWVSTDQLGDIGQNSSVMVRGKQRGTLAKGPWNSAETFKIGGVLQPTKFKRLVLKDEDVIKLRQYSGVEWSGRSAKPAFLDSKAPSLAHVPGVWFHVLAYPLAGDVTKALLRPAATAWKASQRKALQRYGETLIAKCAKAGQWRLAETLIAGGVPCPDLSREFEDVCGGYEAVQTQWKRDFLAIFGTGRPPSLVDMAAWETACTPPPIRAILGALRSQGQHYDLGGTAGRQPLIVEAAEAGRWDIVQELLEEEEGEVVFAAALVASRAFPKAPAAISRLAQDRSQQEDSELARARSLKDYFTRMLSGEVISEQTVPRGFTSKNHALENSTGLRVLDCGLRLGAASVEASDTELVFVTLSENELAKATVAAGDQNVSMLPFDLNRRTMVLGDPSITSETTSWLAVLCPKSYVKKSREMDGVLRLCIPANAIPAPYVLRKSCVLVTVVTPCCGDPLGGVPVYIGGRWAGVTATNGTAEFWLAAGKYIVTAPNHSFAEEVVEIDSEIANDTTDISIAASGELFMYLQDMSTDEEEKDSIMLCTNRANIPEDASRYVGTAALPGSIGQVLCVRAGVPCSDGLSKLKVSPSDGREYLPKEDLTWFDDFRDECEVAMLFSGTPLRLGDLVGPRRTMSKSSSSCRSSQFQVPKSTVTNTVVVDMGKPPASGQGQRCPCPRPSAQPQGSRPPSGMARPVDPSCRRSSRPASQGRRRAASTLPEAVPSRGRRPNSAGCGVRWRQSNPLYLSEGLRGTSHSTESLRSH
eukprot:TRINITY_DN34403_c0_g1_i1.p1 TRINITY_DN34403_c0_g1~~TRINITY_DN34403_c0_g1_i1.p1  ORF type:complete len:891 (+),score=140.89 TRINITY_DN34403_c0_g1_i1:146-2818(+)